MDKFEEINVIVKKGKPGVIRVAITYPSVYEIAISSLSYQMLYFYINSWDEFIAERFNVSRLQGDEPPPTSIEHNTHLSKFDVIVFSVHYEPDFVNILRLLQAAGIPVWSRERRGSPLVIAGGPPVIANPEPLVDFLDVAVIGEIETTIPYLLELLLEYRGNYRGFLESLPPEKGFYTPSLGKPDKVEISYAKVLEKKFHPVAQVQPLARRGVNRSTRVEVSRGCFRACSFCMEGHVFKIMRERDARQVLEISLEGSTLNMTKRVTVVSLSFFDHSQADNILGSLVSNNLKVSIPSLRAETLNEKRLELMIEAGQKTLTIAPETANRQLAFLLKKYIREDIVEEVALSAKKLGFKSIKLYFMIGIPGEKIEDIEAIAKYVKKLSEVSGFKGVREVKVTISPFIPKPQTPMQWFPMEDIKLIRRKIALLKKRLGGLADVREYDPRWAKIQCIIARGDREISDTLLMWARSGGGLGGWRRAVNITRLREEKYLGAFEPNSALPWSFISLPIYPRALRSS